MHSLTSLARPSVRAGRLVRSTAREATAGARRRVRGDGVALTFDDGPHPASTTAVLDVLAALDVRATFFCVGRNALQHGGLVRRALVEGHAVGSHSMTHPHPAETTMGQLAIEYRSGRSALTAATEKETALFRPPHGHLTLSSAAMIRRQALSPWLWSVDPQDWRPGVSADHVATVAGAAGPGDVILLHDWVEQPWAPAALDRSATIEALPAIVSAVRQRGLEFVTLPPR